ncbi:2-keto-4-pentenoate hydratase/2-oxohepta-3-ene-1,7-dioic acid hydratase (Catechol pathway) (modular protein) [Acidobacteriia bacterium SbA2]|nr:2-keto-4-pentenoate hydratase/2-oxohepta-3-ene-1,7-dioic acid hydratase (Catechol pathway) (modular protein) [Acidobacteriia bacterium SbA2]
MKLVTFTSDNEVRLGAVRDNSVIDLELAMGLLRADTLGIETRPELQEAADTVLAPGAVPRDMTELLGRGDAWRLGLAAILEAAAAFPEPARLPRGLFTPLERVRLRAPLLRPGKIVCVGLNYESHRAEQGIQTPARPIFFLKSNNTICGLGDPIVLPPNAQQVDFEAEFAVVIGKRGKAIPEEKVFEHIAGYTILNDVSARDLQIGDKQWFRGKSCDTFAPLGPWIVTKDEIPDPHALGISLTLNGNTMQDSNTSDLIFKIQFLVNYLSQSLTWEPGDLLSTGTPGGVGHHRQPPVHLRPGDSVSITVEKIGTLTNPVVGP